MRKRTITTAVGSCELPAFARETIHNSRKRQSEDASMRDAIPLICTRVCCWWHATRSIFRERSLEKIERCRTSESLVCHAPAATDNHGYFTNTEYFRISLIPSFRTAGTTGEIRRRHRRNVGPELIERRGPASLLSRCFSGVSQDGSADRAQRGTYDPKRRNKLLAKPIRLNETERLD